MWDYIVEQTLKEVVFTKIRVVSGSKSPSSANLVRNQLKISNWYTKILGPKSGPKLVPTDFNRIITRFSLN